MELTKVSPFRCEIPEVYAQASHIFDLVYSDRGEDLFGAGKEACRLILDTFAQIGATICIKPLLERGSLGRYTPLTRTVELESSLLEEGNTTDFIATMIHEMTHALHYHFFSTASSIEEGSSMRELGCSVEEYHKALDRGPLESPILPLTHRMNEYFLPPIRLAREGNHVLAFNEYFARIPEMYYRFGKTHSYEVIEASLREIFPVGLQFFAGRFKSTCEGKEEVLEELDYDELGLQLVEKFRKELSSPVTSATIIYDFLRHPCHDKGFHLEGTHLMISESFLKQFAYSSKV